MATKRTKKLEKIKRNVAKEVVDKEAKTGAAQVGDRQIAAVKAFCDLVLAKYKAIIKSIWLLTPKEFEKTTSLTVIILLNDVQRIDHITKRNVETAALAAERKVKQEMGIDIHPSFYLLSDYWDMIRHGSPVTFSEIRQGLPVYDPSGFFVPLKKLLAQGKIPGTKEAMRSLIAKAPLRIKRIKFLFKTRILEHVYTAVVDAAQALLIAQGFAPPAPKHVPKAVKINLVKQEVLEPEYGRYCEEIISYWKKVDHGEVKEVPGKKLDDLLEKGALFVARIERLMGEIGK